MNIYKFTALVSVYGMYLLTGAANVIIGISLAQLMLHFKEDLSSISALVSAFAAGRVITVFFVGIMSEKIGAKITIIMGTLFLLLFFIGIPLIDNYFIAIILSAIGGVGMSTQDSCCAIILKQTCSKNYNGALSAGQAFFNMGCFIPPLVMSWSLSNKLKFDTVYYFIAILGVVTLAVMPFMKLKKEEHKKNKSKVNFQKQPIKKYVILGIMCFTYFGVINTILTYTPTYVESFGIEESVAVSVLSIYSLGCMIGAFFFIPFLKKVCPSKFLFINMIIVIISLSVTMIIKGTVIFFIGYFVTGFFCGVLFSVLVSMGVSLHPEHAGIAAATVGFVSGGAGILSPLLTGEIIKFSNVQSTFYYIIAMSLICVIATFVYYVKHDRKSLRKEVEDCAFTIKKRSLQG